MDNVTPLQLDAIRIALQFHAALIQQTLQQLAPPAPAQTERREPWQEGE